MTDRPMRTARRPALPGFAAPPAPATRKESGRAPAAVPATPATPDGAPPALLDLSDGPTRQICFYAPDAVRRHLARLVFELDQQGFRTTQSEVLVALVRTGPPTVAAARNAIEAHRLRKS